MGLLGGSAPKAEVFTKSTLTSKQQADLQRLERSLFQSTGISPGGPDQSVPGSAFSEPTDLETMSLAALEQRSLDIGSGGNQTEQAANQALLDLISSGGGDVGGQVFEDFFKTNVVDPSTEFFNEEFDQRTRRFSGNTLFGGERQEADIRADEDFLDSVVGSRANLAFQERGAASDRLLQAINQSRLAGESTTGQLRGISNTALDVRRTDQQDINQELARFLAEAGVKQDQINSLLSSITTKRFENIAVGSGGESSILPDLIQAAGTAAAAYFAFGSDVRLKTNIQFQGLTKEGYKVFTWKWMPGNEEITFGQPTRGVIAQDIVHDVPEAVSMGAAGFLMVDYSFLGDLKIVNQSLMMKEGS